MQKVIDKINASGTRKARPHPTMNGVIIVETIEPRIIDVVVGEFKHCPYTNDIFEQLKNKTNATKPRD